MRVCLYARVRERERARARAQALFAYLCVFAVYKNVFPAPMTLLHVCVLARARVCVCTCMRAHICVWVHVPVDREGTILDPIDVGPFSDREHYRLDV